ncbi:hypothetical protein ZHAS_00011216 [Anopheles sinensis]|uniref:Uncharacterized protein n=1 Tax=Anopheles sinensis TaxID=74873 RepID=A0A084VZM4_ANOSI|nr:hypothetical protein ZHAS_00011216 [Anopheles sinensis]
MPSKRSCRVSSRRRQRAGKLYPETRAISNIRRDKTNTNAPRSRSVGSVDWKLRHSGNSSKAPENSKIDERRDFQTTRNGGAKIGVRLFVALRAAATIRSDYH